MEQGQSHFYTYTSVQDEGIADSASIAVCTEIHDKANDSLTLGRVGVVFFLNLILCYTSNVTNVSFDL